MWKRMLIVLAVVPAMAGCATLLMLFAGGDPPQSGFDLVVRVTDLTTGDPVSGARVSVGFCSLTGPGNCRAMTDIATTDSTGFATIVERDGFDCDSRAANTMVVEVEDDGGLQRLDITVEPSDNAPFVLISEFVSLRDNGQRVAVEIIECISG